MYLNLVLFWLQDMNHQLQHKLMRKSTTFQSLLLKNQHFQSIFQDFKKNPLLLFQKKMLLENFWKNKKQLNF